MQVIGDPVGRLVWIFPPLPGARHDMGAARGHGIIDALTEYEIPASPTPPIKAQAPRRPFRSGAAATTGTPATTGACPATRKTSTPPTPAAADRESESTAS